MLGARRQDTFTFFVYMHAHILKRSLAGSKTLTQNVEASVIIVDVKPQIADKEGILTDQQRLNLCSYELDNARTHVDY